MRNVTQESGARVPSSAAYAAFAAFGTFWGSWGAALPELRYSAGLTDGQLGIALLFVGAGALPGMLLTGRALDRLGLRITAALLGSLAISGVLIAALARDFTGVVVGMLLVGLTSGASDVAINTLAGSSEASSNRPVLTRAHGVFSLAVVVSSVAVGGLLHAGLGLVAVFVAIAVVMGGLSATVLLAVPSATAPTTTPATPVLPRPSSLTLIPLLLIGAVGATAYAAENAHQSWGAIFMADSFGATAQVAAFAPAVFAACATVARFALAPMSRRRPVGLLLIGGAVATAGTIVVAVAPSPATALLGFGIAAAGTAVLFPTLLSYSLRDVDNSQRGRATSLITMTAYLGFLLGPVYVGLVSNAHGLRIAFIGVAALAAVFAVAVVPALRMQREN